MTTAEMLIAAAGLAIAGLVKGATGIGYSTTALPIVALAIGLERAMPLVILPSLSSNLSVMLGASEFRSSLYRFRTLYVALVPGLMTGLYLLARVPTSSAARVLGFVILAYALYTSVRPDLRIANAHESWLNVPVGFCNGLINGLTGSQIMPVVPYALSIGLAPDALLQLTNIAFTLSSLVMIGGLAKIGFLSDGVLLLSICGIIPGLTGVAAGARLRRHISPAAFRKAVLVVLSIMAALLIVGR